MMFGFQRLEVYQLARELTANTYRITRTLPAEEKYALAQQMNRAAVSITSNLAEGSGRNTEKDKRHFINMAYGSLMELVCQHELSRDLGYIGNEQYDIFEKDAKHLAIKLSKYRNSIETK